jgi:hypothetical protein
MEPRGHSPSTDPAASQPAPSSSESTVAGRSISLTGMALQDALPSTASLCSTPAAVGLLHSPPKSLSLSGAAPPAPACNSEERASAPEPGGRSEALSRPRPTPEVQLSAPGILDCVPVSRASLAPLATSSATIGPSSRSRSHAGAESSVLVAYAPRLARLTAHAVQVRAGPEMYSDLLTCPTRALASAC